MTLSRFAAMARLRPYVSEHGIVPSLSALAKLWGYASKASAARIVDELVAEKALIRTQNGRLRPGPGFFTSSKDDEDRHDRIASEWKDHWTSNGLAEAYDLTTRITRLAEAIIESARETAALNGLTVGELLVLDVLYRMGPPFQCAPTTLTHHFALTLPGVGKRIASLERKGLIDRVASDVDRRSLLVRLNPAGRATLEKAAETDMQAPHIRWARALGSATRAGLIDGLRHGLNEIQQANARKAAAQQERKEN